MLRVFLTLYALLIFLISHVAILLAAAPTLSATSSSTYTDVTILETTGSVSWTSGDFLVVQGVTEDNAATISTPATAGSGVTFAAVSSTPTNTASTAKSYAWTATASATSSGTITATTSLNCGCGITVWVFSGSDGLGNTAINANTGATTTISLVRGSANSFVTWHAGDWNAVGDTAVTAAPAGGNQRVAANNSMRVTSYAFDWGDQGAAGTTSYGIGSHAGGGQFSQIALEIKGTGAAPAAPKRLLTLGAGD